MKRRNAPGIRSLECLVLCLFAGVMFTYGAAAQQPLALPPPDHDPFVGVWKANPDKSHPKLTGKDAQCQWGSDRTDGPCTVVVSREGDEQVSKIIAVGLTPLESAHNESRARCDGVGHLLQKPPKPTKEDEVFRAGDASEMPRMVSGHSGNEPASRSYMACWYVAPHLVEGETGLDLHDPNKSGEGNAFFFGPKTYWMEEVSPDGQEMTYTEFKDKKRTKIIRTVVYDRIK
jgi:hypothetical protein